MSITILDVAKARGVKDDDGSISGSEFERVGLSILGGCMVCHATLGAYNGCPSRAGFWACRSGCIEQVGGFDTVEDFELWCQEEDEGR